MINFHTWLEGFKEWFEGLYGTSASGEVGGFNPVGPNSDLDYVRKGNIRSATQQTDNPKKKSRLSNHRINPYQLPVK